MDDLEPQYEYSDTGFPVPRPIQYFALAFRSPNVLRLVNVDQHIASCVQEKVPCRPPTFGLANQLLLRCVAVEQLASVAGRSSGLAHT